MTPDDGSPAPYPADTLSKGWRFELNTERWKKSDTWLRARTGYVRAHLLLLWSEAWEQTPCGSLPADDELLCLMLDMEPEVFAQHRAVLMRGWWRAEDGRLYHETITECVLAMIKQRTGSARRQAGHKERQRSATARQASGECGESNSLPASDSGVSNDTGTGTGTREIQTEDSASLAGAPTREVGAIVGHATPTENGALRLALKRAGVDPTRISLPDPSVDELRRLGATLDEFEAVGREAVGRGISRPLPWITTTMLGRRRDAAAGAKGVSPGGRPPGQPPPPSWMAASQSYGAALCGQGQTQTHPAKEAIDVAARILD